MKSEVSCLSEQKGLYARRGMSVNAPLTTRPAVLIAAGGVDSRDEGMADQCSRDTRVALLAGLFLLMVGPGCGRSGPTESPGVASQAIGGSTCVRIQRGAAGGVDDTYITEHQPTKNWGASTVLSVGG